MGGKLDPEREERVPRLGVVVVEGVRAETLGEIGSIGIMHVFMHMMHACIYCT